MRRGAVSVARTACRHDRQDARHDDHHDAQLLGHVRVDRHHRRRREPRDQRERDIGPQQVRNSQEPGAVAGVTQHLVHAEENRQLHEATREALFFLSQTGAVRDRPGEQE
jgi:hypothetical protein